MSGGSKPALGRLRTRAEFRAAGHGRRFASDRMTVRLLRRDDAERGLRLGFTLTRKVGHATERNRIRRRFRAASAIAAAPFASEALDVVVIGRREALSAPFSALVEDLARALSGPFRHENDPGREPRSARSVRPT